MATICFGAGLVLALALLISINRKLDGIPPRVWTIAHQRREHDDARALTALQEAVAVRVGAITTSLRQYEEQTAAAFREQVEEAQARTRVAERTASDTETALGAASVLVRELRAILDVVRPHGAAVGAAPSESAAPQAGEPDPHARRTIRIGEPPLTAGDGEPEEEPTTVAPRPPASTVAAANGLRLDAGAARSGGRG